MRVREAVCLARPQVGEIAGKQELPGPVESDLETPRPRRQLEKINAPPKQPRDKARELGALKFRDRRMAADRAELPDGFEGKGPDRAAAKRGTDVLRALPALPFGKLTRGRRRLAGVSVNNVRAIAGGPDIRRAVHPQVRFRDEPPFVLRRREPFENRRGRTADRA